MSIVQVIVAMDKCCCTYAQQICPSCGRRAKDVAIFCQEAKRTDVMCSGHRIVDIPGELCPRCSGKRNASRNTPHHYSHAPGNAATVTTGGNTVGRRRLSLTNLLGLTSKGSQSNLQKYVKKPDLQSMVERVSSLGTGTTTAAAWRAQHRDADRFLSTRYDSAEMPPDRVQAEVVLDCVSLPDSQSTIWFPTTERIRAMPGQPATVPTEARRRDTSAQDFLPSPQIQKPGAGLVTRVSASGPLSAPHADDMVQGRQEHVLDRPHDGSQFDRTAGTSLRRMQSDRRSLLGGEPTPPVPERNPRRLNAGTLQRRDSEETTWSALDPKRLSVPGFNTAEPSVADVPCLAIIPRPVQPSISPSTAGEVGLDVRLGEPAASTDEITQHRTGEHKVSSLVFANNGPDPAPERLAVFRPADAEAVPPSSSGSHDVAPRCAAVLLLQRVQPVANRTIPHASVPTCDEDSKETKDVPAVETWIRSNTVEKYVESSRQCRDVNEGKEPAWWENARQTVPGETSSDSTPKVFMPLRRERDSYLEMEPAYGITYGEKSGPPPKASPPSGEDEGPPQGGTDAAWPGSFRPNGRATGRQMNEVRGNGGSAPPGEAIRRAVPVPESTEPREFCQVDILKPWLVDGEAPVGQSSTPGTWLRCQTQSGGSNEETIARDGARASGHRNCGAIVCLVDKPWPGDV
ncbi:hypothetical protein Purlil1_11177 [Purpureocillium lilacinum]|uniref:Uncharacterized protein n=1 Tax=Purpureocillium lilacinum TaxID=33203 RepID=A0ABR0BK96_PURLI|nr:hypothetical protein Purlil1_11177 [Purpureocillium lilacinum]